LNERPYKKPHKDELFNTKHRRAVSENPSIPIFDYIDCGQSFKNLYHSEKLPLRGKSD